MRSVTGPGRVGSGRGVAAADGGRCRTLSPNGDNSRAGGSGYRERAALAGGVDPRAGRVTVRSLVPVWLDERRHSVWAKDLRC